MDKWKEAADRVARISAAVKNERFAAMVKRATSKGLRPHVAATAVIEQVVMALSQPTDRGEPNMAALNCSIDSIKRAIVKCASTGLTPTGSSRSQCWLIPYKGELDWQISIDGLIELAYRDPDTQEAWSNVIYEGDEFRIVEGAHRELVHIPRYDLPGGNEPYGVTKAKPPPEGRGKPIGAYACLKRKGNVQHLFVPEHELMQARAQSRASDSPAYKAWPDMMRQRTAVRRAARWWHCSPIQHAMAVEVAQRFEPETEKAIAGEVETTGETVDTTAAQLPEPAVTPSINEQLKAAAKETADVDG